MPADSEAPATEAPPTEPVRPVTIADHASLPVAALLQLMLGYWVSQSIYVAARLRVADALTDGPRPVADLAATTGADEDALYRLLRALVTAEVFEEREERVFALTPLSELLVSDAPGSVHALAIWHGEPWHWGPWGDLLETVSSGRPAFDRMYGNDQFTFFQGHPEAAAVFDQAMSGFSTASNLLAVSVHDFTGIDTLVDVGGGHGEVLIGLLQMHARLRGVLLDRPPVVEAARARVDSAGLTDRCELVGGDFFKALPAGHGAYLLSMVINDWDDEHALAILRTVRQAMRPDSVLLLAQMVIPPPREPSFAKLMDLEMLVHTGGRERTEEEFASLLARAELELSTVTPTISPVALLVARAAHD